ncbi:hypothetical protein B0H19DRAFT_1162877 [Mycena capillaripes]|nr:hypothetical protein B0H19DRAFT_1162877 [Mycena capillaripes]
MAPARCVMSVLIKFVLATFAIVSLDDQAHREKTDSTSDPAVQETTKNALKTRSTCAVYPAPESESSKVTYK